MPHRNRTSRVSSSWTGLFIIVAVFLLSQSYASALDVDLANHHDNHSTLYNSTDHGKGHGHDEHEEGQGEDGHGAGPLVVAKFNYKAIKIPLILTIVVLVAGLSKLGYHHAGILSSKIPESCILIIMGTVFGAIVFLTKLNTPIMFDPHTFFVFLLPPIILEASFSLHDRTVLENIGSILLFAVVGTVFASAFIGLSLYGLAQVGAMGSIPDVTFIQMMIFSSLIVAVDPVAVLAVFNEIGVNHVLYFMVFGESLLNDGVTVVLYKVFQSYNVMEEITAVHILLGFVKFFVVCLGGLALGVISGIISAILTKYSTHVKVTQPIIIYGMAYLGFLLAEMFEFSGIISIIGCGLTQIQYAFHNISDKSCTTIKYFTKVTSSCSEIIIFLFLGLSLVNDHHYWHTGFTVWTIILCLVFRFIIIFVMCNLINKFDRHRVRQIGLQEQFMIAYGGLRGAVCFSLVALLSVHDVPAKDMFMTTTLAFIIFTVFVQGITIKPLVELLKINLAPEKSLSMYQELSVHVTDHLMAGMEDIIGDHGRNHFREKIERLDTRYLKPWLEIDPDPKDAALGTYYEDLLLKEHYTYLKLSGAKTHDTEPETFENSGEDKGILGLFRHRFHRCKPVPSRKRFSFNKEDKKTPLLQKIRSFLKSTMNQDMLLDLMAKKNAGAQPGGTSLSQEDMLPGSTSRLPNILIDEDPSTEVSIRKRQGRSKSVCVDSDNMDPNGLRSLLLSSKDIGRKILSRYDRNLTSHGDAHAEIRKRKTNKNVTLQRLFSQVGSGTNSPASTRRRQQSWCESESQAVHERGHLHPRGPRHATTVDFGTGGVELSRMGTSQDSGGRLSPHLGLLESVYEEKATERRPLLSADRILEETKDFARDSNGNMQEMTLDDKDIELHPIVTGDTQQHHDASDAANISFDENNLRIEEEGEKESQGQHQHHPNRSLLIRQGGIDAALASPPVVVDDGGGKMSVVNDEEKGRNNEEKLGDVRGGNQTGGGDAENV